MNVTDYYKEFDKDFQAELGKVAGVFKEPGLAVFLTRISKVGEFRQVWLDVIGQLAGGKKALDEMIEVLVGQGLKLHSEHYNYFDSRLSSASYYLHCDTRGFNIHYDPHLKL